MSIGSIALPAALFGIEALNGQVADDNGDVDIAKSRVGGNDL